MNTKKRIVLLVGGVGGAKLAYGLAKLLPPEQLTLIVNTGDDFWHYGLRVCPDLDTITYTLGGVVNPQFGWGLDGDTRETMDSLEQFGEEPWFGLGDRDLATHLYRTKLLHQGESLTKVTQRIAQSFGVEHSILPMTDAEVPTMVETEDHGTLGFQEYFVKHGWQPTVKSIYSRNVARAGLNEAVRAAIYEADAIVIGPSNPWLSINPILSVSGMRAMIEGCNIPRIAITPIIQGKAVKGPTAKIMRELGYEVTPNVVCEFYDNVINGFIVDKRDDFEDCDFLIPTRAIDTLMTNNEMRVQIACDLLIWLEELY